MNKNKQELLGIIKMIEGIRKEEYKRYIDMGSTVYEASINIGVNKLICIKELSKIFIAKINEDYMELSENDTIVEFISEMVRWFEEIINHIIDCPNSELYVCDESIIKIFKMSHQLKDDFKKLYENSRRLIKTSDKTIVVSDKFIFGRTKCFDFNLIKIDKKKENYDYNDFRDSIKHSNLISVQANNWEDAESKIAQDYGKDSTVGWVRKYR
ncbi:hypothetical protein [Clostridium botulinum]|uniref:hypothetical protein n=1 Tax=Clostridium botulinum TaxID=1491 RepID=UPI001C9A9EDC|nr:hypothetical protein [Clostridium botulinum]MBY6838731.1 hypothetical protein [Clostridium botulinum]